MSNRLVSLEAARGLAAIVVIFHHFILAFEPALKNRMRFTPLFALSNGSAAVMFFFVLSGFVLTRRFYVKPSPIELTRSVLKRLPRLMVPVSVTILAGLAILVFLPPFYKEAAQISGSRWLMAFGGANFPADFAPSLQSVLKQTYMVFLAPNNFYYNSNLWTMFDEFYGSMLVFALVGSAMIIRTQINALHLVTLVLAAFAHPNFVPFVLGSWMAYVGAPVIRRRWISAALLVISLALFSTERWTADVVGALLVMLVLLGDARISESLSGRIGSALGALSFPIYLVHTLVIVSIGSFVYARFGISGALLAVLLSSIIFSLPLIALERAWVPALNQFMKSLINDRARVTGS